MNTQKLHDGFQTELVRRGLPVEYASGAAAELADHHRDVVDELRATGLDNSAAETEAANRLGDRRSLVKKSVREFQRRHWCGRWPLLTFLLGPIPLLFLIWAATMLVALCILWPLEKMGLELNAPPDGIISTGERVGLYVAQGLYLFVAPALVMFVLARLIKRSAMGSHWLCLGAGVLAAFVGLFLFDYSDVVRVDLPADKVMMVMGLPMFESWAATWKWYTHDPLHIVQFLLPLGIAAAMVLRSKQLALRSRRPMIGGC